MMTDEGDQESNRSGPTKLVHLISTNQRAPLVVRFVLGGAKVTSLEPAARAENLFIFFSIFSSTSSLFSTGASRAAAYASDCHLLDHAASTAATAVGCRAPFIVSRRAAWPCVRDGSWPQFA